MNVFHCDGDDHRPTPYPVQVLQCPESGDTYCKPCVTKYNDYMAEGFFDRLKRGVWPECPSCTGQGWMHFRILFTPPG